MDVAVALTSFIALIMSLGSVVILNSRRKFVIAISEAATLLRDISTLLTLIAEAQADDTITQDELNKIVGKAKDIQSRANSLKNYLMW